MKKILLLVMSLLLICGTASAQGILKNLGERAKQAVENNLGNKVEDGVNKALDGVLGGKKNNDKSDNKTAPAQAAGAADEVITATSGVSDFVRGSVVFFNDTMENERVGEFPSMWDLRDGSSCEVVTIAGVKAIKIDNGTQIQPLMKEKEYLPELFTIEFDVFAQPAEEGSSWDATLDINLEGQDNNRALHWRMKPETMASNMTYLGDWDWSALNPNGNNVSGDVPWQTINLVKNQWNHIALSFNERAFKAYINGNRVINVPNMIQPLFWFFYGDSDSHKGIYIRNVVMAKGAVELYDRNTTDYADAVTKAIEETGKFVTNNILFETGKATLKPESMEEIQKVAEYMKKNPSARFEVQGHTDNQGSDAVNDPLSQQRAEAVVAALEKEGVDPFNLRPVGKGSHEPVADNSTDEGRAKNRRVEFIKK